MHGLRFSHWCLKSQRTSGPAQAAHGLTQGLSPRRLISPSSSAGQQATIEAIHYRSKSKATIHRRHRTPKPVSGRSASAAGGVRSGGGPRKGSPRHGCSTPTVASLARRRQAPHRPMLAHGIQSVPVIAGLPAGKSTGVYAPCMASARTMSNDTVPAGAATAPDPGRVWHWQPV